MTEIAASKILIALVPVPSIAFAVIETSTQVALLNLLTFAVATAGVAFSAWIALKQAQLKKTVDVLEKNTNGMKEALVTAVADAGHAKGIVAGMDKAESKAAAINVKSALVLEAAAAAALVLEAAAATRADVISKESVETPP